MWVSKQIGALFFFVVWIASTKDVVGAENSIKPTHSRHPNVISFVRDDFKGLFTHQAVWAAGALNRSDVLFIDAHGDGQNIVTADGTPISLSELAGYITARPGFAQTRVLFLHVCDAGSCNTAGSSVASKLLVEIHKVVPTHEIAVIAPNGVLGNYTPQIARGDDSKPMERVFTPESSDLSEHHRNPELLRDVEDAAAFMVVEWDKASNHPNSSPMARSVIAEHFHWNAFSLQPKADKAFIESCARNLSRLLPGQGHVSSGAPSQ